MSPASKNEVPIILRCRGRVARIPPCSGTSSSKAAAGHAVQLGELGALEETTCDKTIFHKNLERVVYVTAEMAGRGPAYAVLNLQSHFEKPPAARRTDH